MENSKALRCKASRTKISELKPPDRGNPCNLNGYRDFFCPHFFKNLIFTLIGFLAGNTATGHSVHAALFRSASVPYGLPCRIKYDDAEHRHRPAVSCIQFAFFSFAISSAIWRHMSLRNFTSSSKSSMRERGTSFS